MATREDVIRRLGDDPHAEFAVAIWCVDDVVERAKENGITLTEDQAKSVLRNVDHKQDCSMGISWDTLDYFIDEQASEGGE